MNSDAQFPIDDTSRAVVASILDSLPANAAMLDTAGRIVFVNRSWKEFAASNGYPDPGAGLGQSYLAACGEAAADPGSPPGIVASAIDGILHGRDTPCVVEYDCHSPREKRWFFAYVRPVLGVAGVAALVLHENVTALRQAEEDARRLNSMLSGLLKRRSRPLSDVDLNRIEAACDTPQRRIVVTTLNELGLRVSELSGLAADDFDWVRQRVRVGARVLPVPVRAADLWHAYFSGGEPAFAMSTRQIQRIVRAAGEEAGLAEALSPQTLRHTFAVRLIERGASPELVGYAMGYQGAPGVDERLVSDLAQLLGV